MTLNESLQPDPTLTEANEKLALMSVGLNWTDCKGTVFQVTQICIK